MCEHVGQFFYQPDPPAAPLLRPRTVEEQHPTGKPIFRQFSGESLFLNITPSPPIVTVSLTND